jgi:hypothetical protein
MMVGWLVSSLCACGPAVVPTSTATATPVKIRPTLPPTWTPTLTSTVTATPTSTPTPTATPTLNPETLCDNLVVESTLEAGRILARQHFASFLTSLPAESGLTLRFVAIHTATGERQEVEVPGDGLILLQIPAKQLPLPGRYDWTLSVHSETLGELCPQHGWLIAVGRESTRAEEPNVR